MSAKALKWVAFIVLGAGLVTGFMPVTSQGENCSSVFIASNDAWLADVLKVRTDGRPGDAEETCTDLRSILRIPAVILLGAGVIALITSAECARRGTAGNRRKPETTSEA